MAVYAAAGNEKDRDDGRDEPAVNASGYNLDVITFLMNSFLPYNGPNNYFNMGGPDGKDLG